MAREDLQQIARFIARDNPQRAKTFVGELRRQCDVLREQPDLGVSREDYAKGLRRIIHGPYLIFYSLMGTEVRIERVLHGARDVGRFFESGGIDIQNE